MGIVGLLFISEIGLSQNVIESVSPVYDSLDIDNVKINSQVRDLDLGSLVDAQVRVKEVDTDKPLYQLTQKANGGKVNLKLPISHHYLVFLDDPLYIDTSFVFDLRQITAYKLDTILRIRPKKVNMDITIRDIDTDETLYLGGTLNNLNRNEQINLRPEDSDKGTYHVKVREEDEYEMEINSQGKNIFYTNNRIVPKKSREKKLEVKVISYLKEGSKIPLYNITFAYNSAELNDVAQQELDRVITLLIDYPNARLEVAAHTDSQGADANNFKLSQKRAQAVFDYLVTKGVNKNRLITKGYGSSKPIASNDTEEGRAKNRRFELIVLSL